MDYYYPLIPLFSFLKTYFARVDDSLENLSLIMIFAEFIENLRQIRVNIFI